jgi:aminopeptidase N
MAVIDPDLLHQARLFVRRELAKTLRQDFINVYEKNRETGSYAITPEAMGQRSLKNICLSYLLTDPQDTDSLALCLEQYSSGSNMTDVIAALAALSNYPGPEREEALDNFYERWKNDPLVLDKWLIIQATSYLEDTLERVKGLLRHPSFSLRNPNKVRSLIGAFCSGNHVRFHDSSGEGYRFLTEQLMAIDPTNAQIAARMVGPFINWRKYDVPRQEMMREQLERLAGLENLSDDLYEIVKKSM